MMMQRTNGGFTVLEILMAITLLVIAMAIVGPPTARAFDRASLRAAVTEVVAAHDLARTMAVQYGRTAQFRIESQWQDRGPDAAGRLEVHADTTTDGLGLAAVRRILLTKGRVLSNRRILCFDGRGLPTTQGICEQPDATIVLQLGSRADTLRYTPMGQVLP